jgi:hypothetical protein
LTNRSGVGKQIWKRFVLVDVSVLPEDEFLIKPLPSDEIGSLKPGPMRSRLTWVDVAPTGNADFSGTGEPIAD